MSFLHVLAVAVLLVIASDAGVRGTVASRSLMQVAPTTGQATQSVAAPLSTALNSGNTAAGADAIKATTTQQDAIAAANAASQQAGKAGLTSKPAKEALKAPVTNNFLASLNSAGASNPNAAALTVAQLANGDSNTVALVSNAIGQAIVTKQFGPIINVLAVSEAQLAVTVAGEASQFNDALHKVPAPAGPILIQCLQASNPVALAAATQAAQLAAPALGAAVHGLASQFGRKLLGAAAVIAI